MGWKKSIAGITGSLIITIASASMFASVAVAADNIRKIALHRVHPDVPLTRDEILSRVKQKYKGRILSVQEKDLPGYPDCHVIRMLSIEGEYLAVHVACSG